MMKVVKLKDIEKELDSRVTAEMETALKFLDGDHFQDGDGYVPARIVSTETKNAEVSRWQNAFVSEDTIGKITGNEQNGILGREPDWQAVIPDLANEEVLPTKYEKSKTELESALVQYWNEREMLKLFREAHKVGAGCQKVVIRAYIPSAILADNKLPNPQSLVEGMKLIYFEVLKPNQSGVFLQAETYRKFGVFKSKTDDGKTVYEVTTLDDNGNTVLTRIETTNYQQLAEETIKMLGKYMPADTTTEAKILSYDLDGTLFFFEIEQPVLVTESMMSNQRQVNFNHTAQGRSTYQGGFRDIVGLNAEQPVDENGEPVPIALGGGKVNMLNGVPVYKPLPSGENELIGYANPDVRVIEPVNPENFIKSIEAENSAMYRQACQEHLAISESAIVSGKSKKESRDAFEKRLKELKSEYDGAGRWMCSLLTRLAAIWTKREKEFEDFRFDFNFHVDAGTLEPEEITQLQADHEAGRISTETYLTKIGIEDVDAEIERLRTSPEAVRKQWSEMIKLALEAKQANLPPEFVINNILQLSEPDEQSAFLAALKVVDEPNEGLGLEE